MLAEKANEHPARCTDSVGEDASSIHGYKLCGVVDRMAPLRISAPDFNTFSDNHLIIATAHLKSQEILELFDVSLNRHFAKIEMNTSERIRVHL